MYTLTPFLDQLRRRFSLEQRKLSCIQRPECEDTVENKVPDLRVGSFEPQVRWERRVPWMNEDPRQLARKVSFVGV